MNDGYVLAGYAVTVGSLGLYAIRVLRRGRVLARSLPGDVPLAGAAGTPGAQLPTSPGPAAAGDG